MTVPPQLTSSLPSFSYPASFRHPPPASSICENQAFSILHQAQAGRTELIKKDGGEMLVSIVLDRPLDEAKALVEDPDRLISEITAILESKQAHPLLDQMVNPDVRDDMPIADFTAASSSRGFGPPQRSAQTEVPQDRFQ